MIKSFYLNNLAYYIAGLVAVVFVLSYFQPAMFRIAGLILLLLGISIFIDFIFLYSKSKGIIAVRIVADRFSIGDPNKVIIRLVNNYGFPVRASIIDELPIQFQERKWIRKVSVERSADYQLEYILKPTTRGQYVFNNINVYAHAPLQLIKRRYIFPAQTIVKVYPSYVQMRRYQLLAVSNRLQEAGAKRIRKIGHSMEFEQIKEY
ncbi:MAG: DUF58 domain-containing protein, partial [Chitinophagaceae bacterium]